MSSKLKRQFMRHQALYEEAIQKYVCAKCIDSGEKGVYHSKDPQGCYVLRNLPELIKIALDLHKREVEPYLKAVREHVCANCANSHEGHCAIREASNCSLDIYLPLVLEALEEAHKEISRSSSTL